MRTFSGRNASQLDYELDRLVDLMREHSVRSYVEIGARDGDTFHHVMTHLERPILGVAVDLPNAAWGHNRSKITLTRAIADLQRQGLPAHVVLGDSRAPETRSAAEGLLAAHELTTFDAALIDGDHRYEGCRGDFERWRPITGKLIAFHDIAGVGIHERRNGYPIEVPRLWREVRESYPHEEIIDPERPGYMGIGVLVVS